MASIKMINPRTNSACPTRKTGITAPLASPPVRGSARVKPYTMRIGRGIKIARRRTSRLPNTPMRGFRIDSAAKIATKTSPAITTCLTLSLCLFGLRSCWTLLVLSIVGSYLTVAFF